MNLPILNIKSSFDQGLREARVNSLGYHLVIEAPPGAGKTTQVPLWFLDQDQEQEQEQKIYLIQPRKLAAKEVAKRLAQITQMELGKEIGYSTRDEKIKGSKLEVVTDGLMVKWLQNDPELSGVSTIILDEYHERTNNYELILGMAHELVNSIREDLNLVVMSATLPGEGIANQLGFSFLKSEGSLFDVQNHYLENKKQWSLVRHASNSLPLIVNETKGDILFFLPGKGEIHRVMEDFHNNEVTCVPLYGGVDNKFQKMAFEKLDKRKLILCTNIAETSITIEGIKVVIDSGMERRLHYNVSRDSNELQLGMISKANAEQRRGRAGRLSEGDCYRLWSERTELRAFPQPELLNSDLKIVLLELALWGVGDFNEFPWIDKPTESHKEKAEAFLKSIKALDVDLKITEYGKKLLSFPLNVEYSHFVLSLIESVEIEEKSFTKIMIDEIALFLSLLSAPPYLSRGYEVEESLDVNFEGCTQSLGMGFKVNHHRKKETVKEASRFKNLIQTHVKDLEGPALKELNLEEEWLKVYSTSLFMQRENNSLRYVNNQNLEVVLSDQSSLRSSEWIIGFNVGGSAQENKFQLASAYSLDALKENFESEFYHEDRLKFNAKKQKVEWQKVKGVFGLDFHKMNSSNKSKNLENQNLSRVFDNKQWKKNLESSIKPVLYRFKYAKEQSVALENLADEADYYLNNLDQWLFNQWDIFNTNELDEINVERWINNSIDYEMKIELDQSFPVDYELPTKRRVRIDYQSFPKIEAKVQEFFGVQQHPLIGGEAVSIDLLSPAMRPIQRTNDLISFFKGSYADVKKEMKSKYPRHNWPDEPLLEKPSFRSIKSKPKT